MTDKIKVVIKKYWAEGAAVLWFSLLLHFSVRAVNVVEKSSFGRFFAFLSVFSSFAALMLTLRYLWRKKWKKAFTGKLQTIMAGVFGMVSAFIDRILERFGKARKDMLGGKTAVIFDSERTEKKKKHKTTRKWRSLESDRERLGFLYVKMIENRLKSRKRVRPADTPSELKEREENSPPEEELFDIYIESRYNEKAELSEQELQNIKDRLEYVK